MTTTNHPFASLAKPPYRYAGSYQAKFQAAPGEPVKPGASCDYCGQAIMNVHTLIGSDGRRFKVGGDCVRKAAMYKPSMDERGAGFTDNLASVKRSIVRAEKAVKNDTLNADFAIFAANPEFRAMPHPSIAGKTFADYCAFILERGGDAIKKKLMASAGQA